MKIFKSVMWVVVFIALGNLLAGCSFSAEGDIDTSSTDDDALIEVRTDLDNE